MDPHLPVPTLKGIEPKSAAARLGTMKLGDTIVSVNDVLLDGSDMYSVMRQIRDASWPKRLLMRRTIAEKDSAQGRQKAQEARAASARRAQRASAQRSTNAGEKQALLDTTAAAAREAAERTGSTYELDIVLEGNANSVRRTDPSQRRFVVVACTQPGN